VPDPRRNPGKPEQSGRRPTDEQPEFERAPAALCPASSSLAPRASSLSRRTPLSACLDSYSLCPSFSRSGIQWVIQAFLHSRLAPTAASRFDRPLDSPLPCRTQLQHVRLHQRAETVQPAHGRLLATSATLPRYTDGRDLPLSGSIRSRPLLHAHHRSYDGSSVRDENADPMWLFTGSQYACKRAAHRPSALPYPAPLSCRQMGLEPNKLQRARIS